MTLVLYLVLDSAAARKWRTSTKTSWFFVFFSRKILAFKNIGSKESHESIGNKNPPGYEMMTRMTADMFWGSGIPKSKSSPRGISHLRGEKMAVSSAWNQKSNHFFDDPPFFFTWKKR